MSLFKLREFWRIHEIEDENFDQNSLIVTNMNSGCDYVITGSQSGVLRVFKPSSTLTENNYLSGFRPTDVLIETSFDLPILQLACGRLASGSMQFHLAVLHPRVVSVFHLKVQQGITDHGTQHYLDLLYQHNFESSAANFLVGPFGKTLNRDFICVQTLDGMLIFFEQESPSFKSFLPDILLPGPIVYLEKIDCFVTINSCWNLVAYKFNQLPGMAEKTDKNISNSLPEWTVNLGEMAVDISGVDGEWILVLGERNLFCFNTTGTIRFMKHLDYSPICFHSYLKDGDIFSLIVSENSTLLIYQNTTLKWSAKIQFLPICIRRIFLPSIQGAIVLLSEEGRLECSYLGTEPSPFIAPPLSTKSLDLIKVEEELETLNRTLKSYRGSVGLKHFEESDAEKVLNLKVYVDTVLEPCTHEVNLADTEEIKMCAITIEILPQVLLEEVQISLLIPPPVKILPYVHHFSNLRDKTTCHSYAYLNEYLDIPTLDVDIIATVITSAGDPRCVSETLTLPLKLVAEIDKPQKEQEHKVILQINQNPVPLAVMFSDLLENSTSDQPTSAIGIKYKTNSSEAVTILLAKSSNRYRIQSNSLASLNLATEQLIFRLHKHYSNVNDFKIYLGSSLPTNEILPYISKHFKKRQEATDLDEELQKYCWLMRRIEKRLIIILKAKNSTPLKSLELLMKEAFNDVMMESEKLEKARHELLKNRNELSCVLNLIRKLISLMDLNYRLQVVLMATFCNVVEDLEGQYWEDIMDSSLCYLLRSVLAKSNKDKLRSEQTNFEEVKDISKLEKHIVQVIERINRNETLETEEIEGEDSNEEDQEIEEPKLVGSQFGEASSRLLSARKSLIRKRNQDGS